MIQQQQNASPEKVSPQSLNAEMKAFAQTEFFEQIVTECRASKSEVCLIIQGTKWLHRGFGEMLPSNRFLAIGKNGYCYVKDMLVIGFDDCTVEPSLKPSSLGPWFIRNMHLRASITGSSSPDAEPRSFEQLVRASYGKGDSLTPMRYSKLAGM